MLFLVRYSVVALTAVVVLAAPASSFAKSRKSGSDAKLVACVKKKDGTMLLRPASTTRCKKGWKEVWWNVNGPQGPAGKNGTDGSNGAQGSEGPAGGSGAQGPQGPAGSNGTNGTNGVSGLEVIALPTPVFTNGSASAQTFFCMCGSGKRPISGGWKAVDATNSNTATIYGSYPDTFAASPGWMFLATAGVSNPGLILYIVCVNA